MIIVGILAATAMTLAWAAARCPLGRALGVGMRCLEDSTHADLH
jgi:hypothetical protein